MSPVGFYLRRLESPALGAAPLSDYLSEIRREMEGLACRLHLNEEPIPEQR